VIQVGAGQPANQVAQVSASLRRLGRSFTRGRAYTTQVGSARASWKKAQADEAALFADVRALLRSMYPGQLGACMYCERSEAEDIDHFRPMSWYPGRIFDWLNYVYSCAPCNKKKGSKLRLHDRAGVDIKYARPRKVPPIPPPRGTPLLINPREEDPMQFFGLDLGTGVLVESAPKGSLEFRRAKHTLDKLGLNKRELPVEW